VRHGADSDHSGGPRWGRDFLSSKIIQLFSVLPATGLFFGDYQLVREFQGQPLQIVSLQVYSTFAVTVQSMATCGLIAAVPFTIKVARMWSSNNELLFLLYATRRLT
jgi:hypothetical protein